MKIWYWLKNLFSSPKKDSAPVSTTPTKPVTPPPVKGWQIAWAQYLRGVFALNLETFSKAVDITTIRPDFFSLTREEKVEVLVTFVRGMCYYESGFKPNSSSVDVGTPKDKDTHSVGLLQMSVVDQANYGFKFGYNYDDLKDPIKNLKLAMAILQRQVERKGRIILRKGVDTGVYWAVIYIGGKYDKSKEIIAGVKALKFDKVPVTPGEPVLVTKVDEALLRRELVRLWRRDVGARETNGNNRSTLIDSINKAIPGAYLGAPYCISGLLHRGVNELCKLYNLKNPVTQTPSTQEFYDRAPAKFRHAIGEEALMADIGIEQSRENSSTGHAYGHTEDEIEGTLKKTIEYNTNDAGGRDGDGVYEKTRSQNGDSKKRYRGCVDVVSWILSAN